MREIRFRAWDKTNKKMLDRVLAGPGDPCSIVWLEERRDWVQFDEFCGELMQFTGLKDVNGQEIFEGDIVRWEGAGTVFTRPVVWDVGEAMFLPNSMSGEVEVIGNIYEHPELLEKESH